MTFSEPSIEGMLGRETDQVYIVLLTIDHPSLSEPLRFSRDSVDTVSRGPLTAVDRSLNGHDATLSLDSLWGNSLLGSTGLTFPGNEILHYVDCPNGAMNGLGDFTFECLIQPDVPTASGLPNIITVTNATNIDEFQIELRRSNGELNGIKVFMKSPTGPGNDSQTWDGTDGLPSNLADGTVRRLAITRNSTTGDVELFLQEEGQSTATSYGTKNLNTGTLTVDTGGLILGQDQGVVGGSFNGNNAFKGSLDDVRIWSDIRTKTEIEDNAFTPLLGNETGLNAYWSFNEGNLFIRMPFNIVLPGQPETRPPSIHLSVDNVDRQIVQTLRTLSSPPSIKVEIVLFSSPEIVELTIEDFELKNASYNMLTVTGEWNLERLRREPFPGIRFDLTNAPGLIQ